MWGAVHRGRTYVFTGPAEQQKFLANPDRYSPVMSGNDPVLALNQGQSVVGRREFGWFFNDRVYLFSSEESLNEFARNPNRYSAEITAAMRQ
jgi:YHS domain-containing protein